MKRLARSECLISMCPSGDSEQSSGKKEGVYEEGAEKKRRLSVVQVKALEKKFEMENKLEPERKLRLAQELGLHPRQVAVWFQNRRARWKTKQLERDFRILKASYESLQHNFDSLHQSNQLLLNQLRELKSKMNSENTENNLSITEEEEEATEAAAAAAVGSDSSAILNEGNSPNASTIGYLNLSESSAGEPLPPAQFVKMEEHDFFSEDTCNFYSEDQAPTLHWWT